MTENTLIYNRSLNFLQVVFTGSSDIRIVDTKDFIVNTITTGNYKERILTVANLSSLECLDAFYRLDFVANHYPEFLKIHESIMLKQLCEKDILILTLFIILANIMDSNNNTLADTVFKIPIITVFTDDDDMDNEIPISTLYENKELKIPIPTNNLAICSITNCVNNRILLTAAGLALNIVAEDEY